MVFFAFAFGKNRKLVVCTHLRTDIKPAGMKAFVLAKRTPIAIRSANDTAILSKRRHE